MSASTDISPGPLGGSRCEPSSTTTAGPYPEANADEAVIVAAAKTGLLEPLPTWSETGAVIRSPKAEPPFKLAVPAAHGSASGSSRWYWMSSQGPTAERVLVEPPRLDIEVVAQRRRL